MNINLQSWFAERHCAYLPKHFVCASTPISDEKHLWILEKCIGRYYIGQIDGTKLASLLQDPLVYFEDPQEAIFYELTWS